MSLSTTELDNPWVEPAPGDTTAYDIGEVTIGTVKIYVRSAMIWDKVTQSEEQRVRCFDVRASNAAGGRGVKSFASDWFNTLEEAHQLYDILVTELSAEMLAPSQDMHIIDRLYALSEQVELAKQGIV